MYLLIRIYVFELEASQKRGEIKFLSFNGSW